MNARDEEGPGSSAEALKSLLSMNFGLEGDKDSKHEAVSDYAEKAPEISTEKVPENAPEKKKERKGKKGRPSLAKFLTNENEAESNEKLDEEQHQDTSLKSVHEEQEDDKHLKDMQRDNDLEDKEQKDNLIDEKARKKSRLSIPSEIPSMIKHAQTTKHTSRKMFSEEQFSHKPQINKISEMLLKDKRKAEKNGKKIWEHLYDMDKLLKEKRDQNHLEKKREEEAKSLESCTFAPEIKKEAMADEAHSQEDGDIYERSKQWKDHVDEKIKKKQEIIKEQEKQIYVFKPEIVKPVLEAKEEIVTAKGVNKFLERQKVALEARKEKEMYQRRDIGSNWTRKVTVPAEFSITTSENSKNRKAWKNETPSSPAKKEGSPKHPSKEPFSAEEQVDFEKARKDLHKSIQQLHI